MCLNKFFDAKLLALFLVAGVSSQSFAGLKLSKEQAAPLVAAMLKEKIAADNSDLPEQVSVQAEASNYENFNYYVVAAVAVLVPTAVCVYRYWPLFQAVKAVSSSSKPKKSGGSPLVAARSTPPRACKK